MSTANAALGARVRRALADLEQVIDRTEDLMNKFKQTGDDGYLDGTALNLHGFYTGVERIFEDIARNVDRNIPSGPDWHQDLLLQMSAEIKSVRPQVIDVQTRSCLNDYRGFRHVVRNVYTFNLRSTRVEELAIHLRTCYESVDRDVSSFIDFLEQLA